MSLATCQANSTSRYDESALQEQVTAPPRVSPKCPRWRWQHALRGGDGSTRCPDADCQGRCTTPMPIAEADARSPMPVAEAEARSPIALMDGRSPRPMPIADTARGSCLAPQLRRPRHSPGVGLETFAVDNHRAQGRRIRALSRDCLGAAD